MIVYRYDGRVKTDKLKVEDGILIGKTFTFATSGKIEGNKITLNWKGEQTSLNLLTMIRLQPSGEPVDDESVVFRRTP
jgi:hypothetical protein